MPSRLKFAPPDKKFTDSSAEGRRERNPALVGLPRGIGAR